MEHRGPDPVLRRRPAGHARHRRGPAGRAAPRRPGRIDPAAPADTGPLSPLEGRAFLAEVLAETRRSDPLLGDAAAAWIGGALADPPFVRSPAEVSGLLGIRTHQATAALAAVRGIAARILTERYGIAPAGHTHAGV